MCAQMQFWFNLRERANGKIWTRRARNTRTYICGRFWYELGFSSFITAWQYVLKARWKANNRSLVMHSSSSRAFCPICIKNRSVHYARKDTMWFIPFSPISTARSASIARKYDLLRHFFGNALIPAIADYISISYRSSPKGRFPIHGAKMGRLMGIRENGESANGEQVTKKLA